MNLDTNMYVHKTSTKILHLSILLGLYPHFGLFKSLSRSIDIYILPFIFWTNKSLSSQLLRFIVSLNQYLFIYGIYDRREQEIFVSGVRDMIQVKNLTNQNNAFTFITNTDTYSSNEPETQN